MSSNHQLRPQLGDFASIVCTKAIVVGTEQALGERAAHVALIAAGRNRGRQIVESTLGKDVRVRPSEFATTLNAAIGAEGTRLCIVDKVEEDGDIIRVYLSETLCSAGEAQGSPRNLTFTLGAVQGAFETITGRALKGKQVASVLRGGTHDVLEFVNRI